LTLGKIRVNFSWPSADWIAWATVRRLLSNPVGALDGQAEWSVSKAHVCKRARNETRSR